MSLQRTSDMRPPQGIPEIMQRFLAICILIIITPALCIIALAVYLESRWPLLHSRRVMGLYGSIFFFYKFRTMIVKADQVLKEWKTEENGLFEKYIENVKLLNDPRITSVGCFLRRWSLDELPHIINVIKGEMNLIGLRPIIEEESLKCKTSDLINKLSVKPGITGYWQVNGRQETTYEERIEADLYYVHNRSIWLDSKILLQTVPSVLSGRGAY